MADKHNPNIPSISNTIAADIPDIKENLEWHKDLLQMVCGWKNDTIASVGPPNHMAQFTHGDDDTLTIGAGSYFHDGTTRQTVFWDAAITFDLGSGGSNALSDALGADEWHYIYLDDSAIITQGDPELDAACFLNDTTAPAWSAAKHGWYNASVPNDRCIFAVLTDATDDILEFFQDGDYILFSNYIENFSNATVATDWSQEVTLSIPAFARKANCVFISTYDDGSNALLWRTEGQVGTGGHLQGRAEVGGTTDTTNDTVIASSNLKIDIKHTASNNNTAIVRTNGWFLPIGM